jgi:hypothetical protein
LFRFPGQRLGLSSRLPEPFLLFVANEIGIDPAWWTGWINGKPTTKTVSEAIAREGQKHIENYKELQKKIEKTVADALDQAPWTREQKK